jgi:hypothetical protein
MATQSALERITERVYRLGDPNEIETPRPLLSLTEFFEENDVAGSIGCNLPGAPMPSVLYEVFKAFAKRPDVADIRVAITYFDDPDWPFSDTVYIITTASTKEVAAWFDKDLAPDDTLEGFCSDQQYEPYTVKDGYRVITCWWD